jgi:hypothetical protein
VGFLTGGNAKNMAIASSDVECVNVLFSFSVPQVKLSAINPIWNRYKSYIGFLCKSYIENGKPGIRADFLYRICIGENFK